MIQLTAKIYLLLPSIYLLSLHCTNPKKSSKFDNIFLSYPAKYSFCLELLASISFDDQNDKNKNKTTNNYYCNKCNSYYYNNYYYNIYYNNNYNYY